MTMQDIYSYLARNDYSEVRAVDFVESRTDLLCIVDRLIRVNVWCVQPWFTPILIDTCPVLFIPWLSTTYINQSYFFALPV